MDCPKLDFATKYGQKYGASSAGNRIPRRSFPSTSAKRDRGTCRTILRRGIFEGRRIMYLAKEERTDHYGNFLLRKGRRIVHLAKEERTDRSGNFLRRKGRRILYLATEERTPIMGTFFEGRYARWRRQSAHYLPNYAFRHV